MYTDHFLIKYYTTPSVMNLSVVRKCTNVRLVLLSNAIKLSRSLLSWNIVAWAGTKNRAPACWVTWCLMPPDSFGHTWSPFSRYTHFLCSLHVLCGFSVSPRFTAFFGGWGGGHIWNYIFSQAHSLPAGGSLLTCVGPCEIHFIFWNYSEFYFFRFNFYEFRFFSVSFSFLMVKLNCINQKACLSN